MTENDKVEIKIGTPNNTTAFYNNGYEFLVNNYTEAVKGTKLEGKLIFSRDDTLGNGFADARRNNQVDIAVRVGLGPGPPLEPYSLGRLTSPPAISMTTAPTSTAIIDDGPIDGVEYTAFLYLWVRCHDGQPTTITAADVPRWDTPGGYTTVIPKPAWISGEDGRALVSDETTNFIPIMDASTHSCVVSRLSSTPRSTSSAWASAALSTSPTTTPMPSGMLMWLPTTTSWITPDPIVISK